ncbi:hypothetical protein QR680_017152 [Steinernema hermaphroditum]|uniref:Sm domain-containing protein n=1 Tax=Steinernema hermaphroditum TaxID=289476 RepID=A0AA39HEP3_9BILA|nr:hypothetical protein QR680_017152 [Steinernema hermaphroditum]
MAQHIVVQPDHQGDERSLDEQLGEVTGVEFIKLCINKMVKIELIDGRDLYGYMSCTDRGQNIILHDTLEVWRDERANQRTIGTTLVSAKRFQKISILFD